VTSTRAVTGSAGALSVVERGPDAGPTVLLLHGYPDTSHLWGPVGDRLASDHHVVAYDVRGAGASDAPAGVEGYVMSRLLEDLATVVDATSGGRAVHLVGHDWGAIQGFAAVRSPTIAARLASFTAVSAPGLEVARWWLRGVLAEPSARHLSHLAGQVARSWYVGAFRVPVLPDLLVRATVERALRLARHPDPSATVVEDAVRGIGLYRANGSDGRFFDTPGVLPADLPVQVVTGRWDPFVSPRVFDDLRDRLGVPVGEVDGGHWLPLTHPGDVAEHVRTFIADVGSR
jgi:pimeloyl-ACP methyl ester carboxylesterase